VKELTPIGNDGLRVSFCCEYRLGLNDSSPHRVTHYFRNGAHVQLKHDSRAVRLHRSRTQVQGRSNLLVAVAIVDQPHDLEFSAAGAMIARGSEATSRSLVHTSRYSLKFFCHVARLVSQRMSRSNDAAYPWFPTTSVKKQPSLL